ncbi:hypothetical protein Nepgr_020533 [Nepenthes gracilis]|uniref:EF-hand domain-containing protein n=1 Tax=Nepenthes gracilis TaxID=150966 RepID=A0AAD3SY76_NEPGR|nr:hypothetical protein Nepgr_020533 [Nepenthes gracilis]
MKLINSINPKQLFSFKKPRSVTRSEPPSFSTTISSLSSSSDSSSSSHTAKRDHKKRRSATPRSVLPARTRSHEITREISGQWSDDASGDPFYELVEAFKMIDRNGDGKITKRELEELFGRIGKEPLSEEEIVAILREIDMDGDGCISLEEFGAISSAFGPASDMAELREAFEVFDVDHDGKITAEELLNVFVAIGDERCTLEDCRGMIQSVDRNGDGFVCFEDFALMMDPQRC